MGAREQWLSEQDWETARSRINEAANDGKSSDAVLPYFLNENGVRVGRLKEYYGVTLCEIKTIKGVLFCEPGDMVCIVSDKLSKYKKYLSDKGCEAKEFFEYLCGEFTPHPKFAIKRAHLDINNELTEVQEKDFSKIHKYLTELAGTENTDDHKELISALLNSGDADDDLRKLGKRLDAKKTLTVKKKLREYESLRLSPSLSLDKERGDDITLYDTLSSDDEYEIEQDVQSNDHVSANLNNDLNNLFGAKIERRVLATKYLTENIIKTSPNVSNYRRKYEREHGGKLPVLKYYVVNYKGVRSALEQCSKKELSEYAQVDCVNPKSKRGLCADCDPQCETYCEVDAKTIATAYAVSAGRYMVQVACHIFASGKVPSNRQLQEFGDISGLYSVSPLDDRMINSMIKNLAKKYKIRW
ncbi:MAG: hypothetical protein LBN99_04660 [Oscillospiraceae bacterium]|nr:hypothetical protein [Oscillospiraceae bacterium]